MKRWMVGVLLVLGGARPAQAVMYINTVPVGNTTNTDDSRYGDFGAVSYAYGIGTYEVSNAQYAEFLNAVAVADTYGLYGIGCNIERSGAAGSYQYSVAAEWANRPVNHVSWGSAARFVNWLQNGQKTGEQGLATTEDGAYYLNGATSNEMLMAVKRKTGWKWAIPSEDEWYKAAYHKNDGNTGNYWDYPTGSDAAPSNVLGSPDDPGNNATFYQGGYTIGSPYFRTEVGAHEKSSSPYGTFDQGGNVWEWNEASFDSSTRVLRGGSFYSAASNMAASFRAFSKPTSEIYSTGFRVVSVLEGMWGVNADGNWSVAGNWHNGVPNGTGIQVLFGGTITAPRTILVDMAVTAGTLLFNNAHPYLVSGSSTLTLQASAGSAAIAVANGSHEIDTRISLAGNAEVTINNAVDTLTLHGGIDGAGKSLTKRGAGTLALSGVNTYSGGTTINQGTLLVGTANGLPAGRGLKIESGGIVVLGAGLGQASEANMAAVPEPSSLVLLGAGVIPCVVMGYSLLRTRTGGNFLGLSQWGAGISSQGGFIGAATGRGSEPVPVLDCRETARDNACIAAGIHGNILVAACAGDHLASRTRRGS